MISVSASRAAVGTRSCPGHSGPGEGLWAAEGERAMPPYS